MAKVDVVDYMQKNFKREDFSHLHWSGSFQDYVDLVSASPKVTRNSFQRVLHMIERFGSSTYTEYKKEIVRYHFFDDPLDNGKDAVFGIDVHLMKLVNFFKSASAGYGTEKRVLLLHGPVGSAKSSIARMIKKGLEHYSRSDEGAMYTYEWVDTEGDLQKYNFHCPSNKEDTATPFPQDQSTFLSRGQALQSIVLVEFQSAKLDLVLQSRFHNWIANPFF